MIPQELVEELRYIEIYTRRAVRDHRVGDYRSPLRGRGFEFDQHKPYQQGDDYRQIDWNATARMRHPFVKKDFEEKELSAIIMADLSRSMEFASVDQSKRELLARVAAILAFSATSNNMKVGLLGFTDRIEVDIPLKSGSRQIWQILESLWDVKPGSTRTDFTVPFAHLFGKLKTSALIFLISDFIQAESALRGHALRNIARKHDLVPVIIEDNWEEALPSGRGFARLRDAEWGGAMVLNLSGKNQHLYRSMMLERRVALERALYGLGLDHLFLHTGESFLDPLIGFFLGRKKRR
ncbi:MAG: DUF58 domain-containing protein [Candidatus Binatia bacterium]